MPGTAERGRGAWAWLALAALASLPSAMGRCRCEMDYHSSQDCTDIITLPRTVWGDKDECTTVLTDHSWVFGSECTTGVFHAATTNCTGNSNSTVTVSNHECKSIGVSGGSVKLTECKEDTVARTIGILLLIIIVTPTLICLCCLGLLIYCCCCRKREKVVVHTVTNSSVGPRGVASTRTNSGRF